MAEQGFQALVEMAMAAGEYARMRPVIEKELLHYDILNSLDRHRLLDGLVFQGGVHACGCVTVRRDSARTWALLAGLTFRPRICTRLPGALSRISASATDLRSL